MKRTIAITLALLLSAALYAADGLRLSTVVIDAGHGGKDPGAVSGDRKTYEKTLTLDIAKKLSEKIKAAYPDVKVILTRSDDRFVTLGDRADKANKAGASLFMSIHINAATSTSPHGYSVHILGQSSKKNTDLYALNMDMVKRENSVILLEDDYSTRYEGFDPSDPESYIFMLLRQNSNLEQSLRFAQSVTDNLKGGPITYDRGIHQDPFYVLWRTAMPSVLVELGFISNAGDLAVLRKDDSRTDLAECLFKAFSEYKTLYDRSIDASAPDTPSVSSAEKTPVKDESAAKSEETASTKDDGGVQYAVQVLVSKKKLSATDPVFLGYTAKIIQAGTVYKYFISLSDSPDTVKKNISSIRKKFPDCFAVKISGETVSRL